jgi:hypothetical protein
MSDTKKELERQDLLRLATALAMSALENAQDSEEPDFLVQDEAGMLGIEHTVIYFDEGSTGGSPLQRAESIFNAFRLQAEQRIIDELPNAELGIFIDRHQTAAPRGKDIPKAAEQIVERVRPLAGKDLPHAVSVLDSEEEDAAPLSAFVDRVLVYPLRGAKRPVVMSPVVGWTQTTVEIPVARRILEKEHKRAANYVRNCSRAWLLLVATGTSAASLVDLPYFDASDIPPTGFERIYLLERPSGQARLLWQNGAALP